MQIKFITSGSNSAFGSFEAGGTMRCSDALAKHLVEELGCAKYMLAPVVPVVEVVGAAPAKRKGRGK